MLKYAADRRTLAFIATYFGLVILAWNTPMVWWLDALMVATICCFSWFCAVITHNTIHCPIFKKRRLNNWMQVVLTQTYGHPVSTFVPGHNLSHHRFTQKAQDVMRTSKVRYRWNLLNLALFFPLVIPAIVRGENLFIKTMRTRKPRWFRQWAVELGLLVAVMAVLLWADWLKFLKYWYLPHVWASMGIVTFNLFQHDGCDGDSEYNHSRNLTGKVFGWFTFNNGYHTIHHMKPTLHWSLCPAAHDRLVAPHMHPNLAQPSIGAYMWRAYVWPGRRENFDGSLQEVPAALPDQNWVPGQDGLQVEFSYGSQD
jgi:fatty acid desaturase